MNYYKLRDKAPNNTLYMKIGGKMIFIPFEDIPAVQEMFRLLDEKDKVIEAQGTHIGKLDTAFRTLEAVLKTKGVIL